jgi:uncharacterized protein YfdQ (DUF2303 family)
MAELKTELPADLSAFPDLLVHDGMPLAFVPEGQSVQTLPQLLEIPRKPERLTKLQSEESFIEYVEKNRQETTSVYFDTENDTFIGVLDDLASDVDLWGHNKAKYTLQHSEEFKAWAPFMNSYQSQRDWIEFLDERADDFIEPSPAEMLTLVRSFRAMKSSEFTHIEHADNGDVELAYSTQTVPDASTTVPTSIAIEIPIWANERSERLEGRFRYRIDGGRLSIRIHVKGITDIVRQSSDDAVARVSEGLKLPVMRGVPGSVTTR